MRLFVTKLLFHIGKLLGYNVIVIAMENDMLSYTYQEEDYKVYCTLESLKNRILKESIK